MQMFTHLSTNRARRCTTLLNEREHGMYNHWNKSPISDATKVRTLESYEVILPIFERF